MIRSLSFFIFSLIIFPAFAQKSLDLGVIACEAEAQKWCARVAQGKELGACLMKNEKNLSTECKQELQRRVQIATQAAGRGGGSLAAFGGSNPLTAPFPILIFTGAGAPITSDVSESRFQISSPVYGQSDRLVAVSVSAGRLQFGQKMNFSKTNVAVPEKFERAEMGLQYSQRLMDKKAWGLRATLGAASDQLFKNSNDATYSLMGNYTYPSEKPDRLWTLFLFYSNNSVLLNGIPLPGFSYMVKTEKFTGLFGLPIASMQWTPVDPWAFSFSVFGPTLTAEASYGELNQVQLVSGFSYSQQFFLRKDRLESKDRTVFEEKQLYLGLRSSFLNKVYAEMKVGQAFDRNLHEGPGTFNKERGEVDLDDAMVASLHLRFLL